MIFLHRTIAFNSVILKNTQTEPQVCIIFFNKTNNIYNPGMKYIGDL